jgi:hypothetical protein
MPVMSENWSYNAQLSFAPTGYRPISQSFLVEGFVTSNRLQETLVLVKSTTQDYTGAYTLSVFDAVAMVPLDTRGIFQLGSKVHEW